MMRFSPGRIALWAFLLIPLSICQAASSGVISQLVEASLRDQNGHLLDKGRLEGRAVLLNFMFTNCTTSCPVQAEKLSALQRSLPKEVQSRVLFVSVSIDAERDSADNLRSFALAHHADLNHWAFVSGSPKQIEQLAASLEVFTAEASKPSALQHTTDIRLLAKDGRVLQRYSTGSLDGDRLRSELIAVAAMPN